MPRKANARREDGLYQRVVSLGVNQEAAGSSPANPTI